MLTKCKQNNNSSGFLRAARLIWDNSSAKIWNPFYELYFIDHKKTQKDLGFASYAHKIYEIWGVLEHGRIRSSNKNERKFKELITEQWAYQCNSLFWYVLKCSMNYNIPSNYKTYRYEWE